MKDYKSEESGKKLKWIPPTHIYKFPKNQSLEGKPSSSIENSPPPTVGEFGPS